MKISNSRVFFHFLTEIKKKILLIQKVCLFLYNNSHWWKCRFLQIRTTLRSMPRSKRLSYSSYPTDFRYGERKQGDTPLHSENYNQGYATEYKSPLVMKSGEQIHNGNNGRWVCAHCNNTNYSNKSVCDYCRAARHGI